MLNKIALLFPGQGSQYKGIGQDLYQQYALVREVYQEASDVLAYDMAKLSFEDPLEQINLTRYTQPVLLTHSIACYRLLQQELGSEVPAMAAAGHSLGEYSALVAAGVLTFAEGVSLVSKRGELMGEHGEGEMQALMIDEESARALAESHHCGMAACNLPEQNVVGGRSADLDALVEDMAEKFPRKRSARLKTEGAFHTFYMQKAADEFKQVLADSRFASAKMTVLSNYTGQSHEDNVDSIRQRLYLQLINPVLWYQNLLTLKTLGVNNLIEFGGGLGRGETAAEKRPNLEGIVKKAYPAEAPMGYQSVINLASLKQTLDALN